MTLHPFLQFPQLFFLTPLFVPLILRLAAAVIFFYMAWHTYARRTEVAETNLPIVGRAEWTVWFAIVVETILGLMLLLGYYAQLGALVGAIAAHKCLVLNRKMGGYDPLSRMAAFMLLVVCLCLIISGAGAFAFDQQI